MRCAQKAPLFASGIVNGYFDGDVPLGFWKSLALYISVNTPSSFIWQYTFFFVLGDSSGKDEIETMCKQTKEVLTWYENMKNTIPTWYKGVVEL